MKQQHSTIRRVSTAALWTFAAAGTLVSLGATPVEDGVNIDAARDVLQKWVETRRIISQEKRDWALGEEILNERIELVQHEIDSLRVKITDAEKSITEADEKRAELIAENDNLKKTSNELTDVVVLLETRAIELLQRLPDPIRDRVKPLSQRIPNGSEENKLSLAERFQNVVGVLNELNKFNREISVASEVRTLPDGTKAEVTSLYLGLGGAYYVGTGGKIAGVGAATENGWQWTAADARAAEIALTVAIFNNEQPAAFVKLPIEIK